MKTLSNSLNSSTRIFLFSLLLLISGFTIQVSGQPYTSIPFSSIIIDGPMSLGSIRAIDWGDIDGDGDFDVVCSAYLSWGGPSGYGRYHLIICENDGSNGFRWTRSLRYDNSLTTGRVELIDFDNDNSPEIFVAGRFLRDGEDNRIVDYRVEIWKYSAGDYDLEYDYTSSSAITTSGCADFDLDGDMDFHFGGRIFQNSDMSFAPQSYYKTDYPAIFWTDDFASPKKADIDNDGDPDSLSTSRMYINLAGAGPFSKPLVPKPVSVGMTADEMSFFWEKASDDDSPDESLSYNLRVGTSPGGTDIISPMANLTTGNSLSTMYGNAGIDVPSRVLVSDNIEQGTNYYWAIESIDDDGLCSGFSAEQVVVYNQFQTISAGKSQISGNVIPVDLDRDGIFEIVCAAKDPEDYTFPEVFSVLDTACNELSYSFPIILPSEILAADFNNDNLCDIAGINTFSGLSPVILQNNGDHTFSLRSLPDLDFQRSGLSSTLSSSDFDNDGDIDLLVLGSINSYLLENLGNFQFSVYDSTEILPYDQGFTAWCDYDNDLDMDVFVSGKDETGKLICHLYKNNSGSFSPISTNIVPLINGSADWGDYNNDGYIDLLTSGNDTYGDPVTKIYENDGMQLSMVNERLIGIGKHAYYNPVEYETHYQRSFARWGDLNNDGYLDIVLYGEDLSGLIVTEVFWNDKREGFYSTQTGLADCQAGSIVLADMFGQDSNLDIIFTGAIGYPTLTHSFAYKNLAGVNYSPGEPQELGYEQIGDEIILRWLSPGDQESGNYLTSNLRIGTTSNGTDVVSPNSDLITGKRYIAENGQAGTNSSWKIAGLPAGTYHWSVQAIDQCYSGGAWAPEQIFTVSSVDADFETDTVCHGMVTSFTDNTVTNGESISGWQWNFGDGNSSTMQNPQHTYDLAGNYTVQLISETTSNADTILHNVIVKSRPSASLFVDIACQGNPSAVSNSTQLNGTTISEWNWDFGDGTYSDLEDPSSHGYISPGDYLVKLSALAFNGCSDTASSTATVGTIPIADVTVSGSAEFCTGDSVTLSNIYNEDYLYQWKIYGSNLSGADSSKYIAKTTGDYSIEVTNPTGTCIEVSDPLTATANAAPSSPTIASIGSTTFCSGDSTLLSVSNIAEYTYQWKLNGGAVGVNSNTFIAKASGSYIVEVTNLSGCMVTSSNAVEITVNPSPVIPTVIVSSTTTFCDGGTVNLSVSNDPSITYQWMNGIATIGGATANSYAADEAGDYIITLTNGSGCISETVPTSVTVNPSPTSPTISLSGSASFCVGGNVTLSVSDDPSLTYQWKKDGGAIGSDQNTLVVTSSGTYNLDVTNGSGCIASSINMPVVTVIELPVVPTVNVSGVTTFCDGGTVNLNVNQEAGISYQWYNGVVTVGEATTNTLDVVESGDYKLILTNGSGCVKETVPVSVTVNPTPASPTINLSGSNAFCVGGSVTLSVTDDPSLSYHWKKDGGTTGSDQNSHIVTTPGSYTLEVSNASSCYASATNTPSVTVNTNPTIPTVNVTGPTTFCEGENVNLGVSNEAGMSYQWYNGVVTVGGATTSSLDADVTGEYKLAISNDLTTCISETLPTFVTVNPTPTSPTISTSRSTTFCDNDSVVLSITDDPTLSYKWLLNGGLVGTDINSHIVKIGGIYTVEVSNASICKATSNTVAVAVYSSPVIPTVGVNGKIAFCEGQSVELSVTNNPLLSYQWKEGDLNVGGAITNSYTATATGDFKLSISNGNDCTVETPAVSVIADPAPTAPTIGYTGALEFCDTEHLVMSVVDNPNYSYEWQLNGGTVGTNSSSYSANATGDYTVRVQNLGDCFAISANTVSLIVHASPASPILNLSGATTFCNDTSVTLRVSDPGTGSYQWISGLGEMIDETATSINVNETGQYKVRIRNTGLCEAFSQEIDVIVNAYPETPVVLSENYVLDACQEEDPVILSVETEKAGLEYQWYRNGVRMTGEISSILRGYLEEGDYSVAAMNSSCEVESQTLTIRYGEMPDKPTIIAEGPVVWYLACSNDSATAYKWYLDGEVIEGADDYLYVAGSEEGKFEVAISENNSCFAKSDPMWIPLGTGIDLDPWENLKIYPNPTPGLFTLEMDNHLMGELIIDIFGETGSKIINIKFHKETAHFKTQIDLSEQPPAAYLIGLMLDKYRTNRTLIVE